VALEIIQMRPDEIDEIYAQIDCLPKDGLMVEWGSGGSTERWLKRLKGNQRLISIEHNEQWYGKVSLSIQQDGLGDRLHYIFKRAKYPGYKHGYGSVTEEHFFGLDEYIEPDDAIWDADLFFIDGVARSPCAASVLLKSRKRDPAIYLHDYVGREHWYAWGVNLYPRHEARASTLVRLYK
jgi:hypothetical protein